MEKRRALAVPYTTIFISELSEATRSIIRKDMEQYAREQGYQLKRDDVTKDYVEMSGRFCDIADIYRKTELCFCEEGEDLELYEKSLQRNILVKIHSDEVDELYVKVGKIGISVQELFENFIADLIDGIYSNGSDERMYINEWFERCSFGGVSYNTFLSYLLDMRDIEEINEIIEGWRRIHELKILEKPDIYDIRELENLQEYIEEHFRNYQEYIEGYLGKTINLDLAAEMEKVLVWDNERNNLLGGNAVEKTRRDKDVIKGR